MPNPNGKFRYSQVAEQIRAAIEDGRYTNRLPPEAELAAAYGVSRGTLREALRLLEAEQYIQRRQGIGTVLLPRPDAVQRSRRPRPLDKNRGRANFQKWKAAVKFPDSFPRIEAVPWPELEENQKLYLNYDHREAVEAIMLAASRSPATRPFTEVVVNRGHGCTTLFRYVSKMLLTRTQQVTPRAPEFGTIPVRFTWSRLGAEPYPADVVEKLIRIDLIRGLIGYEDWKPWDPLARYSRLIGATDRGVQIQDQREALGRLVNIEDWTLPEPPPPTVDWGKVEDLAPHLVAMPILELVKRLKKELEVNTLLMFDLSPGWQGGESRPIKEQIVARRSSYVELDQRIVYIVSRVKDMLEDAETDHGTPLFMEMYFGSREDVEFTRTFLNRSPHVIEFPAFHQADIFGILSRHFPPIIQVSMQGRNVERLFTEYVSTIVNSSLLEDVQGKEVPNLKLGIELPMQDFRDLTLQEVTILFETMIVERIMDQHWKGIPYHLPANLPAESPLASGDVHIR